MSTDNQAFVSSVLQKLKFETVNTKPGSPLHLKITSDTIEYLQKLMTDNCHVVIDSDASVTVRRKVEG